MLYLRLRGAAGVSRLVCGRGHTDPARARIPNPNQIRITLGGLAELRLAAPISP